MDEEQLFLLKLSEECSEISKLCSKAIQFGLNSIDPVTNKSNIQLLHDELNDFNGALKYLNDNFDLNYLPDELAIKAKIEKIHKYKRISAFIGKCKC